MNPLRASVRAGVAGTGSRNRARSARRAAFLLERAAAGEFIREVLGAGGSPFALGHNGLQAAIKAGDALAPDEAVNLIAQWLMTENRQFCPHGRPCVLQWAAIWTRCSKDGVRNWRGGSFLQKVSPLPNFFHLPSICMSRARRLRRCSR